MRGKSLEPFDTWMRASAVGGGRLGPSEPPSDFRQSLLVRYDISDFEARARGLSAVGGSLGPSDLPL